MAEAPAPDDAENWTHDEWIHWLESIDDDGGLQPSVPAPVKKRSLGAQLIGSAMLGLHEMMYGRREERQVQIAPAPGPPDDEDMKITLDPDEPSNSRIRFRNGD